VRNTIPLMILFAATIVLAANNYQPLNVKPGLWARDGYQPVHGERHENGLQEMHYGKRFERQSVGERSG
jgi:hypothetical protein